MRSHGQLPRSRRARPGACRAVGRCYRRRGRAGQPGPGGGGPRGREDNFAAGRLRGIRCAGRPGPYRARARPGARLLLRHRPPAHRAGPRRRRPRRVGWAIGRRSRAGRAGIRRGRGGTGRGRYPVRGDAWPVLAGRQPGGARPAGDRGGRRALGGCAVAAVAGVPGRPDRRPPGGATARRAQRPGSAGHGRGIACLPGVHAAAAGAARSAGDVGAGTAAAERAGR
jgi:hypothetical protein